MSLTSDEMNYLVYRYLLESGFTHAAFALGNESYVDGRKLTDGQREVPPGALISFVQKGLQYCELEANLNEVREVMTRARDAGDGRNGARETTRARDASTRASEEMLKIKRGRTRGDGARMTDGVGDGFISLCRMVRMLTPILAC